MSWYLDRSTEAQMAKIMVQYGRSSRSFRLEFVRSSSGRTFMGTAIWESSVGTRLGKSVKLGMFVRQRSERTILTCVCGRFQNGKQDRKHRTDLENFSWKTLIWENQHYFLTTYIWDVLRESVQQVMTLTNCRDMFESRISASATEKLPTRASSKPDAETISSWSYEIEGHAKKCVERNCELANKTTQQLYKVATPCMDDHQFKEEENESVGELSTVCSQIVLKCLYLARTGRPDMLWSE